MDLGRCRVQLNRLAMAAVVLVLAGLSAVAEAYPQFQFTTGNTTCTACHYSPAGGGLINNWGRDEAADTISGSGDGRVLHGLWEPPSWFAFGGDFRGAVLDKQISGDNELLAFPMQLDLYSRVQAGPVSAAVIVGARGVARGDTTLASRLISREHWLMYQKSNSNLYARVGRFFAPFGLRLQDHTSYVRRFTGFGVLEEPYVASLGMVDNDWEVHASAHAAAPIFGVGGGQTYGGTIFYEKRLRDETAAFGAQARVAMDEASTHYWTGGVGKLWLEDAKLLLLSELDLGVQTFAADPGPSRLQLVGYVGATYIPTTGVYLTGAAERYQPDLRISETSRDGLSVTLQYLPRAHFEVVVLGKLEAPSDYSNPTALSMLMLHYYL